MSTRLAPKKNSDLSLVETDRENISVDVEVGYFLFGKCPESFFKEKDGISQVKQFHADLRRIIATRKSCFF